MKADRIIKNARIFTSDVKQPSASAFVVKDGKFVYVGDEAGLAAYEGEIVDLGGAFVTPAFMDGHAHLPCSVGMTSLGSMENIDGTNKRECLEAMRKVKFETNR